MQKVLKIIFKSTASTDYIYPYFYIKKKEKKYKIQTNEKSFITLHSNCKYNY
jgi:hypothetical protein